MTVRPSPPTVAELIEDRLPSAHKGFQVTLNQIYCWDLDVEIMNSLLTRSCHLCNNSTGLTVECALTFMHVSKEESLISRMRLFVKIVYGMLLSNLLSVTSWALVSPRTIGSLEFCWSRVRNSSKNLNIKLI